MNKKKIVLLKKKIHCDVYNVHMYVTYMYSTFMYSVPTKKKVTL